MAIQISINNYDHGYVPLINTSRSFPHSWLITGFLTRLTQRVPLVEQELPTFPEHLSSPRLLVGSCYSIFSFMCLFCRQKSVPLYFFFWPLCCLFFFDVQILTTHLVSSNSSYETALIRFYTQADHTIQQEMNNIINIISTIANSFECSQIL